MQERQITSEDDQILSILSDAARPRLKMFLSADIVGSTAYKQPLAIFRDGDGATEDWPRHIQYFYKTISEEFRINWDKLRAHGHRCTKQNPNVDINLFGTPPIYWKTVGDEVVFFKELQSEDQIWFVLLAWLHAIANVRSWLKPVGLDIKASAWTAGFPARNRAIANPALIEDFSNELIGQYPSEDQECLRSTKETRPGLANAILVDRYYRDGNNAVFVDFIGSGIDIGFRLGQFATTRKMMLSMDLVYLMSLSHQADRISRYKADLNNPSLGLRCDLIGRPESRLGGDINSLPPYFNQLGVYYSGLEKLKGVLGGVDYPLFWINIEECGSLDSKKTELNNAYLIPSKWSVLKDFCEAFYKDRRNFIFRPFIHADSRADTCETSTTYDGDDITARLKVAWTGMGLLPD